MIPKGVGGVILLSPNPGGASGKEPAWQGFPGDSDVKNPPAMWEIWIQPLGQEDPLEEYVATHFSILVWRIPWTEAKGGLQSMGLQSWTQLSD